MDAFSTELTQFELQRYERQLRLDGFGTAAQRRLKASSVFISRVGGVGGTAAMNLVRAGIGKVVLAHHGKVEPEFLNRCQLFFTADLGRPFVEVWAERLKSINPDVEVVVTQENVGESNVADLVGEADLIVDGAPMFEERYLMNSEAVRQNKPLCMGAMYGMEGYVTAIVPGETPCLACIYPEKPEYWTSIKVFPAIGPGPVIVGTTAALEAIKLLTGFGTPLKGVLWFFDLETNNAKRLHVSRRPDCPVCAHLYQ
jgi:molybdopterin/thiamine biosynthesis adenylyltransferase